jgi:hypothetical protein
MNHRQTMNKLKNQTLTIEIYQLLNILVILLNLLCAHSDYIEQFLDNTKTCLANNIHLVVDYDSLQRVTYNFTRNRTRINCSKVNKLSVYDKLVASKRLNDYFPHVENIR